MLNSDTQSVYTDFNSLAKLRLSAREQSPEAIKQVAGQLESVFIDMMMKSMRQAKLADGILDSQQSEFYREMYDHQLSVQLAGNPGLGLADFIVKQLTPKQNRKVGSSDESVSETEAETDSTHTIPPWQTHTLDRVPANTHANPLDASGLSNLERSLAGLTANRKAPLPYQWQNQDDEWRTQKIADDAAISSKQEFINQLLPHAMQAAKLLGVDANLLLAQAALETGWGQAVMKNSLGESSFNLFNIKADKSWLGKQIKSLTLEFDGGVAKKEMAGFRAYTSYKDSFDDYVNLIKSNPRYSEALKKAGNPNQYIYELQQAGYATDPKYAEKIINIYHAQSVESVKLKKGAG